MYTVVMTARDMSCVWEFLLYSDSGLSFLYEQYQYAAITYDIYLIMTYEVIYPCKDNIRLSYYYRTFLYLCKTNEINVLIDEFYNDTF